MRLKDGLAYAALGLASAGLIGAGAETIHRAQTPSQEEVAHTDQASALKDQIDLLDPQESSAAYDELRKKQSIELIEVSTGEWERSNKVLFGLIASCAGAGALVLGGVKISEKSS